MNDIMRYNIKIWSLDKIEIMLIKTIIDQKKIRYSCVLINEEDSYNQNLGMDLDRANKYFNNIILNHKGWI